MTTVIFSTFRLTSDLRSQLVKKCLLDINELDGTVKLLSSDELNDDLASYAKFWTQLALSHSTKARSRKTL
jgi:hypothetical protein